MGTDQILKCFSRVVGVLDWFRALIIAGSQYTLRKLPRARSLIGMVPGRLPDPQLGGPISDFHRL